MNTHARFLTHFPIRTLTTVVVLSAMIVTHSAAAAPMILDQQVNPPLAHAQQVLEQANNFLDIKQEPRARRLDDEQAQMYGMYAAGTGFFAGTCMMVPPIAQKLINAGAAISSATGSLLYSFGQFLTEPTTLYAVVPVALGVLTYCILEQNTIRSYFKSAVLNVAPIIKELSQDVFFNGTLSDRELDGYVITRFGLAQGVLKAVDHYSSLNLQLQEIDNQLKEVVDTGDAKLAVLCVQLQAVIRDMSAQLTTKLSVLSHRFGNDLKDQLRQQKEDAAKAKLEAQKERDRLEAQRQQERDRLAAIQAGNISYNRRVGA